MVTTGQADKGTGSEGTPQTSAPGAARGLRVEPGARPAARTVSAGAAARRLRDAAEPIAAHALWSPKVHGLLAELGLGRLASYVYARAAPLGDPAASVVVAAFAWFEPTMIASAYRKGWATAQREPMLAARDTAAVASLTEALGDVDATEIAATADLLLPAVEAADGTGRALFCGLRERPCPPGPVGRLWRACDLLREHRGDSHIAATLVAGVPPVEMNILTELWLGMPLRSYSATRGWPAPALDVAIASLAARGWLHPAATATGSAPAADHGGTGADASTRDWTLTDAGHRARTGIEEHTEAQELPIVQALGDELPAVVSRLDAWSQRCIDAGAFPTDVGKRRAG